MRRWSSRGSGPSSICPLIPRCTTNAAIAVAERQPQVLAAAAGAGDARVEQPRGQVGGAGLVTADRAGVVHPHRGDRLDPPRGPAVPAERPRLRGVQALVQRGPRRRGGLELGLFLGPADALAVFGVVDDDRRGEFLVVVRAGRGHHIRRRAQPAGRGQFLQAALPVQAGTQRRRGVEQVAEQPQDHLARHRDAVLQIDCAEQGFDAVGQDAGLVGAAGVLLALAEQQVGAKAVVAQAAADVGQRLGVDDAGAQLGQIALGACPDAGDRAPR